MKSALFLLFILAAFVSCVKEDDDTNKELVPGYTTITGHIVTSDNAPLKGVEMQLKYVETRWLASFHSWVKKEATTDANGSYSMSFNIKDDEVETYEAQYSSYFELGFDFSKLDPDKYFLSYYSLQNDSSCWFSVRPSLKQNTAYQVSFYIPEKDYITVHLNNFKPVLAGDHFEVQTFFPWGTKSEEKNNSNKLLNTEYGISSTGYDNFVAKSENQTFRVPVARNDTNIVRIINVKNGVASPEDHKIFVPKDNNIELTYEY